MSEILFHPYLKLTEAHRIACEQGGRLVWRDGRVRIRLAAQSIELVSVVGEPGRMAGRSVSNVSEVAPCAA